MKYAGKTKRLFPAAIPHDEDLTISHFPKTCLNQRRAAADRILAARSGCDLCRSSALGRNGPKRRAFLASVSRLLTDTYTEFAVGSCHRVLEPLVTDTRTLPRPTNPAPPAHR